MAGLGVMARPTWWGVQYHHPWWEIGGRELPGWYRGVPPAGAVGGRGLHGGGGWGVWAPGRAVGGAGRARRGVVGGVQAGGVPPVAVDHPMGRAPLAVVGQTKKRGAEPARRASARRTGAPVRSEAHKEWSQYIGETEGGAAIA